jgi:hypothetical protein
MSRKDCAGKHGAAVARVCMSRTRLILRTLWRKLVIQEDMADYEETGRAQGEVNGLTVRICRLKLVTFC